MLLKKHIQYETMISGPFSPFKPFVGESNEKCRSLSRFNGHAIVNGRERVVVCRGVVGGGCLSLSFFLSTLKFPIARGSAFGRNEMYYK